MGEAGVADAAAGEAVGLLAVSEEVALPEELDVDVEVETGTLLDGSEELPTDVRLSTELGELGVSVEVVAADAAVVLAAAGALGVATGLRVLMAPTGPSKVAGKVMKIWCVTVIGWGGGPGGSGLSWWFAESRMGSTTLEMKPSRRSGTPRLWCRRCNHAWLTIVAR